MRAPLTALRTLVLLTFGLAALGLAGCPKDKPAGAPAFAPLDGGQAKAVPVLHCEAPTHDFGTAERGQSVSHGFEIQNRGQAPLQIERLHGGRMIEARAGKNTLEPGEKTRIEATLNTQARLGRLKRTLTVYSNDPAHPRYQLAFQGQIETRLTFEPERLFLRQVGKGAKVTRTVSLAGREKAGVSLANPVSNRPGLSARVIGGEAGPQLEVTFEAPATEGRFSGQLTVDTSHPQVPKLILPVAASITGDLVVDKRVAAFAPPAAGKPSSAVVNVSSLSSRPFRVVRVEDPAGAVTGSIEATSRGQRITLRLESLPGKTTGSLRLHTDRKDQPLIEMGYLIRPPDDRGPARGRLQPNPGGKPDLRPVGLGKKRGFPARSMRRDDGGHGLHLKDDRTAPTLKSPPPGAQSRPKQDAP